MYIKTKEPFGAAAVRLGYARSSDIVAALKEQEKREKEGDESPLLGVILVELGILSATQVTSVLNEDEAAFYQLSEDAVRLAARLKASLQDNDQIVQVSGGTERQRPSMLSNQLALALALMKRGSVLLIDTYLTADKKQSNADALHKFFAIPAEPGFSEVLSGKCSLDEAITSSRLVGLDLLAAGSMTEDNVAMLMSERCGELLTQLRQKYRYILLDSPTLLARADAPVIASRADGLVLVVMAGKQRRQEVITAMDLAAGLNKPVFGTILFS